VAGGVGWEVAGAGLTGGGGIEGFVCWGVCGGEREVLGGERELMCLPCGVFGPEEKTERLRRGAGRSAATRKGFSAGGC